MLLLPGGLMTSPRDFLDTFGKQALPGPLKRTLQLYRPGCLDQSKGKDFLTDSRAIIRQHIGHADTALAELVTKKLAFVNTELAALGEVQGQDQSANSNNKAAKAEIDNILAQTFSPDITIMNRRAVVEGKKTLNDNVTKAADHRPDEVQKKLAEFDAYLERANILPEEARVDEPLAVTVSPGVYNHYTITHMLGEGGMARVYLARDQAGRQVALKVLLEEFAYLERDFINEGLLMQKLSHENIVKGFGVGHLRLGGGKPPRPFFVMELMETPIDKAEVARSLPPEQRLTVAYRAAVALDHAYNQPEKIVHRDVKPANILITRDTQRRLLAVKLSDFGLSLALNELLESSTHTKTGTIKGTFTHLTPETVKLSNAHFEERVAMLEAAGPQGDIYAWGMSVYELFTLRLPPERNFLRDKLKWFNFAKAEGEERKQYEMARPAEIPEPLWNIINKAMQIDPAKRYKGWGELLRDLTALIPVAERIADEGGKTEVNIPTQLLDLTNLMGQITAGTVKPEPAIVLELKQRLDDTLAELEAQPALATEQVDFIRDALDFAPQLQGLLAQLEVKK